MEDLEQEKDLEEDEFKTNVKPSTSREMTTRICKKDVIYQFNESDPDEDIDDSLEDEQDEDSSDCDGYSSPDIDYEAIADYEEENSPKINAANEKQENESENFIESAKNCTKKEDQNSDKSDDLYNYDPGCDYE